MKGLRRLADKGRSVSNVIGLVVVGAVVALFLSGGMLAGTSDRPLGSAAPATPVQVAAPEFISKIQQQLDSSEFGGAWIVTTTAGEVVHVGLTSPDAGSLAIVAAAAAEFGLSNSYTTDQVRYSAEQLDGFASQIQSIVDRWPSAEGLLGFGVRTELNKVEVLLTSSQPDLVNTITAAVPADALQVTIVPGATVSALET